MNADSLESGLLLTALALCLGCVSGDAPVEPSHASAALPPGPPPFDFTRLSTVDYTGIPGTLPVLSADGDFVAYVTGPGPEGAIDFIWPAAPERAGDPPALSVCVAPVTGGRPDVLSRELTAFAPRWASRRAVLFFTGRPAIGAWQIYRSDLQGNGPRQVAVEDGHAVLADPNSNADKLVFCVSPDRDSPFALKLLDLASGASRILRAGDADCLLPRWSPDDSKIAFIVLRDEGADLEILDLARGESRVVQPNVCRPERPVALDVFDSVPSPFSPEGRFLAFVNVTKGALQIADLENRTVRDLAPPMSAGCWDDSGLLACSAYSRHARGLFAADPETVELAPLAQGRWIPRFFSADAGRVLVLTSPSDSSRHLALVELLFRRPIVKTTSNEKGPFE